MDWYKTSDVTPSYIFHTLKYLPTKMFTILMDLLAMFWDFYHALATFLKA